MIRDVKFQKNLQLVTGGNKQNPRMLHVKRGAGKNRKIYKIEEKRILNHHSNQNSWKPTQVSRTSPLCQLDWELHLDSDGQARSWITKNIFQPLFSGDWGATAFGKDLQGRSWWKYQTWGMNIIISQNLFFILFGLCHFLFHLALLQVWKFLLGYYQWHQPAEVEHIEIYNTKEKGCKIFNFQSLYIYSV